MKDNPSMILIDRVRAMRENPQATTGTALHHDLEIIPAQQFINC